MFLFRLEARHCCVLFFISPDVFVIALNKGWLAAPVWGPRWVGDYYVSRWGRWWPENPSPPKLMSPCSASACHATPAAPLKCHPLLRTDYPMPSRQMWGHRPARHTASVPGREDGTGNISTWLLHPRWVFWSGVMLLRCCSWLHSTSGKARRRGLTREGDTVLGSRTNRRLVKQDGRGVWSGHEGARV